MARPPPSGRHRSAPKMERRIVEKKRRDYMKCLYSTLFSLLPCYNTKRISTVQDQIDEAAEYIKNLQEKIAKMNEKKDKFISIMRENKRQCPASSRLLSSKPPKFEIHEMGSSMDVVLLTGLHDKQSTFYRILSSLHEDGFDVVHASFSCSGNSMIHVTRAKPGKSVARRVQELLQEHEDGHEAHGDQDLESNMGICDHFDIEYDDIWDSELLSAMPELEFGELTSILNSV